MNRDRVAAWIFTTLALAAVGFLTLMAAFLIAGGRDRYGGDFAVFAVPAVLLAAAAVSAIGLIARELRRRRAAEQ